MRTSNKGKRTTRLNNGTLTILTSSGTFVSWKDLNIASVSERGD